MVSRLPSARWSCAEDTALSCSGAWTTTNATAFKWLFYPSVIKETPPPKSPDMLNIEYLCISMVLVLLFAVIYSQIKFIFSPVKLFRWLSVKNKYLKFLFFASHSSDTSYQYNLNISHPSVGFTGCFSCLRTELTRLLLNTTDCEVIRLANKTVKDAYSSLGGLNKLN